MSSNLDYVSNWEDVAWKKKFFNNKTTLEWCCDCLHWWLLFSCNLFNLLNLAAERATFSKSSTTSGGLAKNGVTRSAKHDGLCLNMKNTCLQIGTLKHANIIRMFEIKHNRRHSTKTNGRNPYVWENSGDGVASRALHIHEVAVWALHQALFLVLSFFGGIRRMQEIVFQLE